MATLGGNYQGPIPLYAGKLTNQASLAANAEALVTVTLNFPYPRNFNTAPGGSIIAAALARQQTDTANASLVVTRAGSEASNNQVTLRVRNVGTVASSVWDVAVLVIDPNDILS